MQDTVDFQFIAQSGHMSQDLWGVYAGLYRLVLPGDEFRQTFAVLFECPKVAGDEADRIIDLVGDSRHQQADGGHFFLLQQLVLCGFEQVIGCFKFVGALPDLLFQALIVVFEKIPELLHPQQVTRPQQDLRDIERFADEIVRADGYPFQPHCFFVEAGHQNDRNMSGCLILLEEPADLETVHAGHHHIEQNKIRWVLQRFLESLNAVGEKSRGVTLVREGVVQQLLRTVIVIHDKDCG